MSTIEHANTAAMLFTESTTRFFAERAAPEAESALFDNPRKMALGNACVYDTYLDVLRRVRSGIEPEDFGRSMKTVNAPHDLLFLNGIYWAWCWGRIQSMLDSGKEPGDLVAEDGDQFTEVWDWWERVSRAYRNDGEVLPFQAADARGSTGNLAILGDEDVERLVGMQEEVPAGSRHALSQLMGQLQLYCFLAHSEARDSIFCHGPYPLGNGRVMVLREFKELRNEYCPRVRVDGRPVTVRSPTPIPFEEVALAIVVRDVNFRFDMFGTLYAEPESYMEHVESAALLTGFGTTERQRGLAEVESITAAADAAYADMFTEIIEWDDRQKVEVGCYQYVNLMRTMLRQAGREQELLGEVEAACEAACDRHIDRVLGPHGADVWSWPARAGERPIFPTFGGNGASRR